MRGALLASGLLVLAGTACTGGPEDAPAAGTPAYATTECPVGVRLAVIGDLDCGTLTVPENRETGTGTVRVFVATLTPPDDGGGEPVVVVGSDMATRLNYAGISPLAQRTGRRVVLMDQRGVGYSVPSLACPPGQVGWSDVTGSPGWRRKIADSTRECYRALTDAGTDVASYDVTEMAADVADLARSLDLDPINLISYGSGSRISLELMRTHPELLRAVVMDSPDLPGVDARDHAAAGARDAIDRVLRWCGQDPDCSRRHPDPMTLLDRALEAVADAPLTVRTPLRDGQVLLDDGLVVRLARRTLTDGGSTGPWGLPTALPAFLTAVATGDTYALSEAVTELAGVQGPLCAGYRAKCTAAQTVDEGVANTVLCRDIAPFSEERRAAARGQAFRDAFDRGWWWDTCEDWPVPPADAEVAEPVTSDVPVLILVGGNGAPVPPAVVRANTGGLTNASIVVDPVQAHNVIGPSCLIELRNTWLEDPRPVRKPACSQNRLEWR